MAGHGDPLDAALRAPPLDLPALAPKRPPRHRSGEKFLKGPVPMAWLERAFVLPGKALHVALLLWFKAGCQRCRTARHSDRSRTRCISAT